MVDNFRFALHQTIKEISMDQILQGSLIGLQIILFAALSGLSAAFILSMWINGFPHNRNKNRRLTAQEALHKSTENEPKVVKELVDVMLYKCYNAINEAVSRGETWVVVNLNNYFLLERSVEENLNIVLEKSRLCQALYNTKEELENKGYEVVSNLELGGSECFEISWYCVDGEREKGKEDEDEEKG